MGIAHANALSARPSRPDRLPLARPPTRATARPAGCTVAWRGPVAFTVRPFAASSTETEPS